MQQFSTKVRRCVAAGLLALTVGLSLVTLAAPALKDWAQHRHIEGLMAGGIKNRP
jgi:hypothetical protein